MRFYHFTRAIHVPSIRGTGLLAKPNNDFGYGVPLVALTALRTTALTRADHDWMNERGYPYTWPTWLPKSERRLTVTLRSNDPYLMPLKMFLKAAREAGMPHNGFERRDMVPAGKHWWVYAGDIPPDAIDGWDDTEGTGVALWPHSEPSRQAWNVAEIAHEIVPSIRPVVDMVAA